MVCQETGLSCLKGSFSSVALRLASMRFAAMAAVFCSVELVSRLPELKSSQETHDIGVLIVGWPVTAC